MVRVLRALSQNIPSTGRVLDFGAFFGNFAIACRQAGYQVDAADFYKANERAFARAVQKLAAQHIGIIDFDHAGADLRSVPSETYDAVLCMGVVEHIPHTPRPMFESINRVLKPGGVLILDTPNLAYIYKRKQLMRGESVFPPIAFQYYADIPFTGHHREYTQPEIEWMLHEIGHEILTIETFWYSVYSIEYLQNQDLENYRLMEKDPSCRELILSVSRKQPSVQIGMV
jgi:2-polyprenyl-3-methyl-5-hydroxy-6-metoxy-1,4-benzoquinol methylase